MGVEWAFEWNRVGLTHGLGERTGARLGGIKPKCRVLLRRVLGRGEGGYRLKPPRVLSYPHLYI